MKEQVTGAPWEIIIGTIVTLFTGSGFVYWRKNTDSEIKAQRAVDVKLSESINNLKVEYLECHLKQQEKFVEKITTNFSNILVQITQNNNGINQSIISLTNALIENQKVMVENHKEYKDSIVRLHERIESNAREHKTDVEKVKENFVHKDHCISKMSSKRDKG